MRGWYTTKQKLWKVMLENKDYNADLVFKIVKRGINFEAVVYQRPKYSVEAEVFYYMAFGFSAKIFILSI